MFIFPPVNPSILPSCVLCAMCTQTAALPCISFIKDKSNNDDGTHRENYKGLRKQRLRPELHHTPSLLETHWKQTQEWDFIKLYSSYHLFVKYPSQGRD